MEGDLQALATLGAVLGRYDGIAQSRAIEDCLARLTDALARAEQEQESRGKLYRTAGICYGMALALLVI